MNESEAARSRVRDQFRRFAVISSKAVKGKEEEGANYANYFDFPHPCGALARMPTSLCGVAKPKEF